MIPCITVGRAQTSHAAYRPTAPLSRINGRTNSLSLVCSEGEVFRDLERARKEIEVLKSELALATLWKQQPPLTQFVAHLPAPKGTNGGSGLRRKTKEMDNALKELQKRNRELTEQVEDYSQQLAAINKEKNELNQKNLDLESDNIRLREQLARLEVYSKDSTLYRALRQTELKVEQLQRELSELRPPKSISSKPLSIRTFVKDDHLMDFEDSAADFRPLNSRTFVDESDL